MPINRKFQKAHKIQSQIPKLPKEILDPIWLRTEYIDKQRDIDDIASSLGCSITPVRNRLKHFSIPIRPQKRHRYERDIPKISHGICVSYKPIKCQRNHIQFRSIIECGYAIYLDNLSEVKQWDYETVWLRYLDGFTGKEKRYICDFKVEYLDGRTEHIEVKPINKQTFEDKYLYAQHQLQGWRWITNNEINMAREAFSRPDLLVEFPCRFSNCLKKFVIWSKDNNLQVPEGYRIISRCKRYEYYYQYRIINDNLKNIIEMKDRPKNLQLGKSFNLDLDKIMNLVKQDKSAKEIANEFNVNYRTITKFLEDRSYVISWSGSSSKHNEIRYATKKIWPTEELPPREIIRNRSNYYWDEYDWLYNKYIVESLSTRSIGKLVNKSGRLILKKLRKHNIEVR